MRRNSFAFQNTANKMYCTIAYSVHKCSKIKTLPRFNLMKEVVRKIAFVGFPLFE